MIRHTIATAVGAIALAALLSSCAEAGGAAPSIAAGERAVEVKVRAHPLFSSVYATRNAVCGVITSMGGDDDADARFLVEFAPDAKGRYGPAAVLIDRPRTTAEAIDFAKRWMADCNAS